MKSIPKCTTGELARTAEVSVDWIIEKTDAKLIDCERRANGRRMYDPITGPQQVRAILAGNK